MADKKKKRDGLITYISMAMFSLTGYWAASAGPEAFCEQMFPVLAGFGGLLLLLAVKLMHASISCVMVAESVLDAIYEDEDDEDAG